LGRTSHSSFFASATSRKVQRRSHELRYVLRNKETSEVYLVILFTLHLREFVNEDGSLKPGALEHVVPDEAGSSDNGKEKDNPDHDKALEEARRQLGPSHEESSGNVETQADDVD
jgi:hypothetical protein